MARRLGLRELRRPSAPCATEREAGKPGAPRRRATERGRQQSALSGAARKARRTREMAEPPRAASPGGLRTDATRLGRGWERKETCARRARVLAGCGNLLSLSTPPRSGGETVWPRAFAAAFVPGLLQVTSTEVAAHPRRPESEEGAGRENRTEIGSGPRVGISEAQRKISQSQ